MGWVAGLHGLHSYLPTREEIGRRAEMLRWMQDQRWDDRLIFDIMMYDSPSVEMVDRLVKQKGSRLAYQVLMEFFRWP